MNTAFKLFQLMTYASSSIAPSWTAKKAQMMFLTPRRFNPRAWEVTAEKSGVRFKLSNSISAIRWRPAGKSPSKKKALLIHGWEGRATQMSTFAPLLLELGYEVIAIDMPAHGHSSGKQTDIDQFANTILKAEMEIGPFDTIVAHSFGGPATSLAYSRGLSAKHLVFIASPSRMGYELQRFANLIGLTQRASNLFVKYMSDYVGIDAHSIDTTQLLKDFDGSLLIVHDENDIEVQLKESQRVISSLTQARLHTTTGLGHRRILKSDEVVNLVKKHLIAASTDEVSWTAVAEQSPFLGIHAASISDRQ